ncbi:ribonuclease Y [Patescibacteria group bacterium]|nr:ribonuclease Y [Patescibacteria group bacterium]MBU1722077.1 ribonuclease Y [Patescibacteria group bacterium]MBU1901357.1 ribonuclease Y [Patescibacteria group bacterium]
MFVQITIAAIISAAIGGLIGYAARKRMAKADANSIEAQAEKRLAEAHNKEQELILKAKEKALEIIEEAKIEEKKRQADLDKTRERIENRESLVDTKLQEFETRKQKLEEKVQEILSIKEKVEEARAKSVQRLEEIGKLSQEDAKIELTQHVERDAQEDLLHLRIKLDRRNQEDIEREAKEKVINAMQRTACDHSQETTGTMIELPSDEMKGRIIGKEGRNIKTIEKMTGCELIIDETPNMLVISSFSPIRRRVCYLALKKLITDGRIQPARIEEFIEESKKELALDIHKAGEEALHKMGIIGIDPKLVSIVGRLKYRTSYGQNVLNHSIEVGYLSGLMAEELGMNPAKARKAGFFHDIGKAIDHETQGAHTEIGHTILKKFNIDEETAEVALTHHDTNPPLLLTKVVMAADAISASRVGARRDTFEQYVARLEELEDTAKDFPGVERVYAIQAGREIRVFVNPTQIDDYQAYNLAKDIARKIESQLQYPGEIKVHLIRESKIIEYAR